MEILKQNSMTSKELLDVTQLENRERREYVKPCLPAIHRGNIEEEIETFQATLMSILCLTCDNYIELTHLQDHRSFHDALSLFQYTVQTKPTNKNALDRQRAVLVKGLNKRLDPACSAYRKKLSEIDLAYEILKSELYGKLNKTRPLRSSAHVEITMKSFKTKLDCRSSLGVCQSANERWKSSMEDSYSYESDYITGTNSGFFAVYDGYNGQTAARKCSTQLHVILKENLTKMNTSEESCKRGDCKFSKCFQQAYHEIDKVLLLGDDEMSRNRWSGCSATTCVVSGQHLHVANVGNVKAMLFKGNGTIETITEDHTPSNKKEKHRIKWNGDVQRWSKTTWVNGITMTTRGLGNHGDPTLKLNVINTPAFSCVCVENDDKIILLGSGGFWEVFSAEEVDILIKDWLEMKVNEIVKVNNVVENTEGCRTAYSKDLIKIMVDGEHQKTLHLNQETKNKIQLPNNHRQPIYEDKKYKKQSADDNKEHDDITTDFTLGNLQDSLLDGKRKKLNENDVENNKISDVLNERSSSEVHQHTSTKSDSKQLICSLLKDVSEKDSCKIAVELTKHLVRAALIGGAKDNITVMAVLLSGK